MKLLTLVFCSCIVLHAANAQKKLQPGDYKLQLRMNPLGVVDPFETNLSAGVDARIKKRLSVGGDMAVYLVRDGFSRSLNGFNVKPFLRLYAKGKWNTYSEIVLMYKHTVAKEEGWLGMDCVNGVPAYEKYDTYKNIKDVVDLSVRVGIRDHLFHSPDWFYEFYIGLGIRQKILSIGYAEPNTCVIAGNTSSSGNLFSLAVPGRYTVLSVPSGMRLTKTISSSRKHRPRDK